MTADSETNWLAHPEWFAHIQNEIVESRSTFRYDRCIALNSPYSEYERGLASIFSHGTPMPDRTGTGTLSQFCHQMRFNLHSVPVRDVEGYVGVSLPILPLISTKSVHFKSVFHELRWMLKGLTNIKYLTDNKVSIWDEWADKNGDLGPVYGKQWRAFNGVDQIMYVLAQLKTNPYSRRLVVSAWNPNDLPDMALQPCHVLFQFTIRQGRLSCHMFQRSQDAFLGAPFNIAQYALLTHLFAHHLGIEAGELVISVTDFHLYSNHLELAKMQLQREARPYPHIEFQCEPKLPWDYEFDDIKVVGYNPHPAIKAPVAV